MKTANTIKLLIVGFIFSMLLIACAPRTYYTNQQPHYRDDGYVYYDQPYYSNQQPDFVDDDYYYFNGPDGYRPVPRRSVNYRINITYIPRLDGTRRNEVYNNIPRQPMAPSTNPVTTSPQNPYVQRQNSVVPRPNSTPLIRPNTRPMSNPVQRPTTTTTTPLRPSAPAPIRPPVAPMSRPGSGVVKRP